MAARSLAIKEFTLQRTCEQLGATGSATLDNRIGQEQALASTNSPRLVTLMGYWTGSDDQLHPSETLRALFSGYGMPRSNVEAGAVDLTLDLFDISDSIQNTKKLSDTFPLDGMYVYDALIHLASWCGLKPTNCNFENLGTRLNAGPHDKELYWYTDSSENILALMQEICVYDYGAALWVAEDGRLTKGCPYCHGLRTGTPLSVIGEDTVTIDPSYVGGHVGTGSHSPGCLAQDITTSADGSGVHFKFFTGGKFKTDAGVALDDIMHGEIMHIERPFLEVDKSYYSCVRVKGPTTKKQGDDSYTKDFTDWPSVMGVVPHPDDWGYSLNYKRTLEKTYGWAVSDAYRTMAAYCLFNQYRIRPEFQTIVVPFLPEVRFGNVFQVYGKAADNIGASGKDFRVWSYAHNVAIGTGRERATTITGRFMRPTPVVEEEAPE